MVGYTAICKGVSAFRSLEWQSTVLAEQGWCHLKTMEVILHLSGRFRLSWAAGLQASLAFLITQLLHRTAHLVAGFPQREPVEVRGCREGSHSSSGPSPQKGQPLVFAPFYWLKATGPVLATVTGRVLYKSNTGQSGFLLLPYIFRLGHKLRQFNRRKSIWMHPSAQESHKT